MLAQGRDDPADVLGYLFLKRDFKQAEGKRCLQQYCKIKYRHRLRYLAAKFAQWSGKMVQITKTVYALVIEEQRGKVYES
jgi:hypothetical protein